MQNIYVLLQQRAEQRTRKRDHSEIEETKLIISKPQQPATNSICHFGHTTTTSSGWYVNPSPSLWPNIQPGITICYRCYQRGRRGRPAIPVQGNTNTTITSCIVLSTTDHHCIEGIEHHLVEPSHRIGDHCSAVVHAIPGPSCAVISGCFEAPSGQGVIPTATPPATNYTPALSKRLSNRANINYTEATNGRLLWRTHRHRLR